MTLPKSIVVDIETAPAADGEPFDETSVALGNRKDPRKVRLWIEQARADWEEQAALSATRGRVLVIGLYDRDSDDYQLLEGEEESVMLSDFWNHVGGWYDDFSPSQIIGFNILRFDLPFLLRRSWKHQVPVPGWVFEGHYPNRCFIDLLGWWQCGNRGESISLDRFGRFLGLGGKERVGKDFHLLYERDRQGALAYIKADLRLTAQIAERLGI